VLKEGRRIDPDVQPLAETHASTLKIPYADLFPTVYNGRKNKSAINPRGWRWQRWKCINKCICTYSPSQKFVGGVLRGPRKAAQKKNINKI